MNTDETMKLNTNSFIACIVVYGKACLPLILRRKCDVYLVIGVSTKPQFVDGIRSLLAVNTQ